jgi:hypothetical protein
MDVIFILMLVLIPFILQLMAISVYTERLGRAVRRSADRPPFTSAVVISELGPEPRAVARLLDRATRLDPAEVDQLIDSQGGQLPLLMSHPAAQRLVQELRQLGAAADLFYADTHVHA